MSVLRLLAFSALGAVTPAGRDRAAGRPVDWAAVSLESLAGGTLPTADYEGRVVLLVNTASRCGFTGQYRGLETLWRRYRDRGLVVLGVPSNDFGRQEPGSADEIRQFCEVRFGVSFPLAAKQVVSGPAAHPLYRWAAAQTGTLGTPSWNFHKILIGRDGRVRDWFSAVSGTGAALARAIETALSAKG
ncbi:MAG: glutathione peroxidase [Proteobacteria bacterium]|nr:glutathione peroxidase [Pseudomonadota bacterium]